MHTGQDVYFRYSCRGGYIVLPNYRVQLSAYGKIVDNTIRNISAHYENITVDKYVIMPNHIHIIPMFENNGRILSARMRNHKLKE